MVPDPSFLQAGVGSFVRRQSTVRDDGVVFNWHRECSSEQSGSESYVEHGVGGNMWLKGNAVRRGGEICNGELHSFEPNGRYFRVGWDWYGHETLHTEVLLGTHEKKKTHLEDLDTDGRMILKWNSRNRTREDLTVKRDSLKMVSI